MRQGYRLMSLCVRVVADRVALAGIRLESETGVEFIEPVWLPRREDHVRHQPFVADSGRVFVKLVARLRHHFISQKPILLDIGRGRRD
jgi:hypothetical protein